MKHLTYLAFGLVAWSGSQAMAQEWTITPEIYARGGVTYKSDFSREAGNSLGRVEQFNLGPYGQESLIDYPLTEITLHASYGDELKYHYGVDVNTNRRFVTKNEEKSNLAERINYLEYKIGQGATFWFGNRPYRSLPEYLSRAFLFDEKNLMGGGLRFENVGPLNVDLAYGSFGNDYAAGGANFQENTNIFINKLEYPLNNGIIKTNLEIQQTKRTSSSGQGESGTSGYLLGVNYQRWGDQVLGGNLYNSLIVHTSKGYVQKTIMNSAFNQFDPDFAASKYLLSWNGDWKASKYAVYWVGIYQQHMGKSATLDNKEMIWKTLDGIVRPLYAVTPNLNVGAELMRRSVLKEGLGLQGADWAKNTGMSRWGALVNYTLENKNFSSPTVGILAGEVKKDKLTNFYPSAPAANSTHFVHFFYEAKIN